MRKTNTATQVVGPTFLRLTVLFIGLKLTGFITWSWLWVLSPLWTPTLVVPMLVVIGLIAHLLNG